MTAPQDAAWIEAEASPVRTDVTSVDLAELSELAQRFGPVPQRELHCHPDVTRWLSLVLPEAQPEFPFTGAIGSLTGIPVIENADYEPGKWELYEDGEVTVSGHIEVPPWVTAPVLLDVAPLSVVERLRMDLWFPYVAPVPIAALGSVI